MKIEKRTDGRTEESVGVILIPPSFGPLAPRQRGRKQEIDWERALILREAQFRQFQQCGVIATTEHGKERGGEVSCIDLLRNWESVYLDCFNVFFLETKCIHLVYVSLV